MCPVYVLVSSLQSACSFVDCSVFENSHRSRLVDTVNLPVEFLSPLGSEILSPILPQESPSSTQCLAMVVLVYLSQLLGEASQTNIQSTF